MLFQTNSKMNQPDYVFEPGTNHWVSNKQLLETVSDKPQFIRPIFFTGSSHINKAPFRTELKSKFCKGMPRKGSVISHGGSWGYSGGSIGSLWVRERMFETVQAISHHPDYHFFLAESKRLDRRPNQTCSTPTRLLEKFVWRSGQ